MKEKIFENYGYKIKYLFYRKELVSFLYDNQYYIIQSVNLEEQIIYDIDKLVNYLEQYNIFFHKIIMTKSNKYLFEYNNNKYILLQVRIVMDREVTIEEITTLTRIKIDDLQIKTINPGLKIANKIDTLEQFVANYEKKYIDLLENFNYFVGMAETSITLYNTIDISKIAFSISHKRLNKNKKAIYFYNPLEIIIDFKTRDIVEYVKDLFFNEDKDMLLYYLRYINYDEYTGYFARLLYPSFYFDAIDSIISNETSNYDLEKINLKINNYEKSIKKTYFEIQKYVQLPYIEWLSDVNNF